MVLLRAIQIVRRSIDDRKAPRLAAAIEAAAQPLAIGALRCPEAEAELRRGEGQPRRISLFIFHRA